MPVVDGVTVLMPPPEGYIVDFANPRRRAVLAAYIVAGLGIVLAAFMMGQRLYVKGVLRHALGVDDLLLVLAWMGTIVIQSIILYSFVHGFLGVHIWEISIEKAQLFFLYEVYVNSIVYTVPTTLAKMVILLFYREINNTQVWYRWSVRFVMFVVAGSGLAIFFSSLFPCRPFARGYNLTMTTGSCIDRAAMYQATAAIGVVSDVLIFCIPIPMILSLKMSWRKKAGLIVIFAIGSATVVTSMVRLALLILSLSDLDLTWGGGPICVWICVEANLLIMCASMPTLNHFVKSVAPQLLSSMNQSSNKKSAISMPANHELRTFGAGNSRKLYYNRFDETDIRTDTIVNIQGQPPKSRSQEGSRGSCDDSRSDRGIVQTKETHVYYEE